MEIGDLVSTEPPKDYRFKNLTGMRFARYKVLGYAGRTEGGVKMWKCRCDCGEIKLVNGSSLSSGGIKSCGCLLKEVMSKLRTKHGFRRIGLKNTEYNIWKNMIQRCHSEACPGFFRYGGRGITVCDSWRSFENFLADMGPRPSKGHSLDRFPDNDGNYEPGNCRWATGVEQGLNKRNNRTLTLNGITLPISEWSRRTGLKYTTIRTRSLVFGWSDELTLTTKIAI